MFISRQAETSLQDLIASYIVGFKKCLCIFSLLCAVAKQIRLTSSKYVTALNQLLIPIQSNDLFKMNLIHILAFAS